MSEFISSNAVVRSSARSLLFRSDASLMLFVIGAGVAAAVLVSPALWIATPLVAITVYLAARRTVLTKQPTDESVSPFPPQLQAAIARAMGQLPVGRALHLLNAVIRNARTLFATHESAFDDAYETETRAHVVELVAGACEVAIELARLDQVSGAYTAADGDALRQRYEQARAELTARLEAAAMALAELYASGVEQGTPASDRVAQLAAELHVDADARRAAIGEMKELLDLA